MNNLVSKSPILRFKLGKRILKMQYGGGTYYEVTERPKINTSKAKEESLGQYNRIVHNGKWTWGRFDNNGNFSPINKLVTLNNGTILNLNGSKSSTNVRNSVNNPKIIERGYIDQNGNKSPIRQLNKTTNVATTVTKRTITPRQSSTFMGVKAGNAGAFTLTDEQKALLDLNGIKYGTALELQLGLNNYMASNGINGSILTDNKWGDLSKRALDYVLNRLNLNGSIWFDNKAPGQMILAIPISVSTTEPPTISSDFKPQILNVRNNSYNRSDIRDLIRRAGFNPYNYSGDLRKALRLYLTGQSDDTSLLDGTDLARFTLPYRKQGGLISRNPILRFKSNFR